MNTRTTITLENLSEVLTVRAALTFYVDGHALRRLNAENTEGADSDRRTACVAVDEDTRRAKRLLEAL